MAYYYTNADYDEEKQAAAYHSLLSLDPDNTTALNNLANLRNKQRRYAEAESLATHAMRLGASASFFQNAASAQLSEGRPAAALTALSLLVLIEPSARAQSTLSLAERAPERESYESPQRFWFRMSQ